MPSVRFFLPLIVLSISYGADFPEVLNSQKETIPFVSGAEALKRVHLPDGFQAALFAAEPDVRNPIGMAFDSRGRLWIAENYTYAEREVAFDARFRDRIVILEDTDGDGRSDKRKVFWDKGDRLTSVALGFGGVYALCSPKLLFIPDKNGDDVPDGEPQVLLDGFEERSIRHNLANGLKWGPDGWLYGRHGILATSHIGKPGTPRDKRISLNCSLWRYHPVTGDFEVVAEGTTNPWGHDWDEHGQLFFINTVIGHLWHVVPGAFYKRMYGEHANPHLYELIDQTADHVHWDTRESWDDIRKGVTGTTLKAGGGHAHSGFMIYLGENWPEKFRNNAFTINYHGRRLNVDALQRRNATYVGTHLPDFGTFDDPWFRGIELGYGSDGGVYVLDWSDIGECHDDDGVHRTSGRVYKIMYGDRLKPGLQTDLRNATNMELAKLVTSRNEWLSRESRQILYERAADKKDVTEANKVLEEVLAKAKEPRDRLRALWALNLTKGLAEDQLKRARIDDSEHVRSWATQIMIERKRPVAEFALQSEKSGLVLCFVASALQRLPAEDRWPLAEMLCAHGEFANDHVLPLLIWYGIESAVSAYADAAVRLAKKSKMPKVAGFIARRLTSELDSAPEAVEQLVQSVRELTDSAYRAAVLGGMSEALRGWRKATPPRSWKETASVLLESSNPAIAKPLRELGVVFGDGRAVDELRAIVADKKADLPSRRRGLQALAQSRADNMLPLIRPLLSELEISPDAVRALASLGHTETPRVLLNAYTNLRSFTAKMEVIDALASRTAFALPLIRAIEKGVIKRGDVQAVHVRQLRSLGNAEINARLAEWWPGAHELSAEKKGQILRYKEQLTPAMLESANAARGRATYAKLCGTCHVLFGEGTAIGPDLTGSDRKNIDYLLNNIIGPNGVVADSYRLSTIRLKDERVINGVVGSKTERTLAVQTPTEKILLERREIEAVVESEYSLMPEGLLEGLSESDLRDLFAYLTSEGPR